MLQLPLMTDVHTLKISIVRDQFEKLIPQQYLVQLTLKHDEFVNLN
ncbi:MAG: hypothetical protein NXI08_15300 [bacterium]|nr:hypothetical protein [bacterium]